MSKHLATVVTTERNSLSVGTTGITPEYATQLALQPTGAGVIVSAGG